MIRKKRCSASNGADKKRGLANPTPDPRLAKTNPAIILLATATLTAAKV
jgi:hypothetical protein